ncbi:hypothetical protein [Bradyrhizobium erythrophlei]|jgi:hypothetical protein|uniref:Uncharacterized protein n=1 Tax=Bradyrhizobium erythrophlei TaxID=1437360 RepID=A0A1M7TW55_9BRAD|nr:hypothetical protein [Bradyrhizobium erythrophlei]SHN74961.1 hypothetical protein SAMN05444170_2840 [Bradyrhizobium erythrophlei]
MGFYISSAVPRSAGEPFAGLLRLNLRQPGKGHPCVVIKKTWYVSIHLPEEQKTGHYSRRSETFANEAEAKQFAASKIAAGTEISAGTLNPVTPKRIIKPSEIEKWLAEKTSPCGG